jgi:hypothetical protein
MKKGLCLIAMGFVLVDASAQTNTWTGASSANWENASDWSLGVLPATNQTVFLTNAGWKAVEIGENTSENFPLTLTVGSLTISSPANSFNELLMNYAGFETALVIDNPSLAGSLIIESNSAFVMLSSSLVVWNGSPVGAGEQGAFSVGGTFVENDGSQVMATYLDLGNIGPGEYDLTNSVLNVAEWETVGGFPAVFNQVGGTNSGGLLLEDAGEYDFYGGDFACALYIEGGTFNQWSGNMRGITTAYQGEYYLAGGTFTANGLALPSGGDEEGNFEFWQTGGTNFAGNIGLGGADGRASYTLAGGALVASGLSVGVTYSFIDPYSDFGNTFSQSGGYHTNGAINIEGEASYTYGIFPCYYQLSGGILETPSISLAVGQFAQTGGTNDAGTITVNNSSSYQLSGGQLSAGTIALTGGEFAHSGGNLASPALLILTNGLWEEETNGAQLGQLQLGAGTNSAISLSGSAVMQFAGSSGLTWASNAVLAVQNWTGSLYGGGRQQIIFGNGGNALAAQQLSEIHFQNPAGLPAGSYPARILSNGEIVPDAGASLPPRLGISGENGGGYQLTLQGAAGQKYEIDVSTDLVQWAAWTTQTNASGTISLTDSGSTNYSRRFYRAILAP